MFKNIYVQKFENSMFVFMDYNFILQMKSSSSKGLLSMVPLNSKFPSLFKISFKYMYTLVDVYVVM